MLRVHESAGIVTTLLLVVIAVMIVSFPEIT
jgi:hypothetical protein